MNKSSGEFGNMLCVEEKGRRCHGWGGFGDAGGARLWDTWRILSASNTGIIWYRSEWERVHLFTLIQNYQWSPLLCKIVLWICTNTTKYIIRCQFTVVIFVLIYKLIFIYLMYNFDNSWHPINKYYITDEHIDESILI